MSSSEQDLVKLGKKLKKNNVAVDIINFGEDAENEDKLSKFIEAVNSGDNRYAISPAVFVSSAQIRIVILILLIFVSAHSHLLSIPAGPQLLSDIILSSPVLQEEGGDAGGAGPSGAGGSSQFEFGVDPSMDPELAMVRTPCRPDSFSAIWSSPRSFAVY